MSEIQKLQDALQPGDRIVTTAGLHATVVSVSEELVTLETAPGIVTTWEKMSVVRVVSPGAQPAQEATEVSAQPDAGFPEHFPRAEQQDWDSHPENISDHDDDNRSGGHPENR